MCEKEKEQIIQSYKKAQQKSKFIKGIIIIVLLFWFVFYIRGVFHYTYAQTPLYLHILVLCILEVSVLLYVRLINVKAMRELMSILNEQGDLLSYMAVLNDLLTYYKKGRARGNLLCLYMSALTYQGDLAELEIVFLQNKTYLQKQEHARYLKQFCLSLAAYLDDTTLYETLYAKYHFSKYHHAAGTLNTRQLALHNQDLSVEANYYMRMQDYEKALAIFLALQPVTLIDKLSQDYACAKCCLMLHRPDEAQPYVDAVLRYPDDFRYVRDIRVLLNGEELITPQLHQSVLEEMLKVEKKARKKMKCLVILIAVLLLISIGLHVYTSSYTRPFISIADTMKQLLKVEVDETILDFTVNQEHVGIVKYHASNEKSDNFAEMLMNGTYAYRYTDIVVNKQGKIDYVTSENIGFTFEKNQRYMYPLQQSDYTYVLVEQDGITSIAYQGIPQDIKQVHLSIWNQTVTLTACVIHDSEFSPEYIKYSE